MSRPIRHGIHAHIGVPDRRGRDCPRIGAARRSRYPWRIGSVSVIGIAGSPVDAVRGRPRESDRFPHADRKGRGAVRGEQGGHRRPTTSFCCILHNSTNVCADIRSIRRGRGHGIPRGIREGGIDRGLGKDRRQALCVCSQERYPEKQDKEDTAEKVFGFNMPHGYLTGISLLAPNSPILYTPQGIPVLILSLAGSRGSGRGPVCPIASPEPARPRPFHPVLSDTSPHLEDSGSFFTGAIRLSYPDGSGSSAIRPSILANRRRVR